MLLTLGIPVYNGEKCLTQTLESLKISLDYCKNKNLFEILISDNASIDQTYASIKGFTDKGLEIQYFRNIENIGYDRNINNIVQYARGKYVWFLGCGETLKEDALQRLEEKLNVQTEYSNIVLDFDIYDEALEKITDTKIYPLDNDIILEGKNNFSHDKYALAVSSNIINKRMWNEISNQKLVVKGWAHIERILSIIALNEDSKTLILPGPYFTLFREKNGWWTKQNSSLLSFLLLHIEVIESMKSKGFKPSVVDKLRKQQSRIPIIIGILDLKTQKFTLDQNIIYKMLRMFSTDYFFWSFIFPLLWIPNFLLFIPKAILKLLTELSKVLHHVKKIIY